MDSYLLTSLEEYQLKHYSIDNTFIEKVTFEIQ